MVKLLGSSPYKFNQISICLVKINNFHTFAPSSQKEK